MLTIKDALNLLIGGKQCARVALFQVLKEWLQEKGTKNYFRSSGDLDVDMLLNCHDERNFRSFVSTYEYEDPTFAIRQDMLKLGIAFPEDKIFLD